MKFIIAIDEEKFKDIKAGDYSDVWILHNDEHLPIYVATINKLQDDIIEGRYEK